MGAADQLDHDPDNGGRGEAGSHTGRRAAGPQPDGDWGAPGHHQQAHGEVQWWQVCGVHVVQV